MVAVFSGVANELGLAHLCSSRSPRDVALLIVLRFVRLFAFGSIAPILVLFLSALGFSDSKVGLFLSLTLLGDVGLSLLVSWWADKVGRRRVLAAGAAAMGVSGLVFFLSRSYIPLLLAATFGVVSRASSPPLPAGPPGPSSDFWYGSASGNEVGPFSAIENSILSQLVGAKDRIFILMWYQVLGFVGLALGSVWAGQLVSAEQDGHEGYRVVFLVYAISAIVGMVLVFFMTPLSELDHPSFEMLPRDAVEPESPTTPVLETVSSERRPLLDRTASSTPYVNPSAPKIAFDTTDDTSTLSLPRLLFVAILFSVDSFASSLTPASYVSFFFKTHYGASVKAITRVLASSALGAVATSLLAGALVKRIGLVLAMVTTHLPAQCLTIGMAFAPSIPSVYTLYILRTMFSSIDSSIRAALLAAMVPKAARTRLLGSVDVCRTLAAAPGPFVTGRLVTVGLLAWTFVISGSIKIGYDLALLVGFRSAKLQH
ncbi:hypothetical protein JCM6882_003494 [Rhodosporidiobolus microsporus]